MWRKNIAQCDLSLPAPYERKRWWTRSSRLLWHLQQGRPWLHENKAVRNLMIIKKLIGSKSHYVPQITLFIAFLDILSPAFLGQLEGKPGKEIATVVEVPNLRHSDLIFCRCCWLKKTFYEVLRISCKPVWAGLWKKLCWWQQSTQSCKI